MSYYMIYSSTFALRVAVASISGVALVTGWLQFIYERLVVGVDGVVLVYIPRWWVLLELFSLSTLVIFAVVLRRHDRRVAAFSCGALGLGFFGTVMQCLFGSGLQCIPIEN
jgi:hypothetical protein